MKLAGVGSLEPKFTHTYDGWLTLHDTNGKAVESVFIKERLTPKVQEVKREMLARHYEREESNVVVMLDFSLIGTGDVDTAPYMARLEEFKKAVRCNQKKNKGARKQ